ncbi:MAG: helix-turn-helix transcriptional regulator [Thermoflexaceae bacterium]|nr:helix-turn-helix transcriptional regulator [Thermoflexaceae bacterium]
MGKQEIGNRIKELRKLRHFSRDALAERVSVSPKFIYDIEMGKKGFSAELLKKFSDVLGASCEYIMSGDDEMRKNRTAIEEQLSKFNKRQLKYVAGILENIYKVGNE